MVNEFIWWFGLVWLVLLASIGVLHLIDCALGWIIDGFKFRAAFFRWYADYLRGRTKPDA